MSVLKGKKINQMLQSGQKNGLLFATWLIEHGYSRQLLSRYRSSGWLSSLCKGVMYRTGNTLSAFGALQSFNEQVGKSFRVAAHSALELWGFNHYVPMGKPLLMVSTAKVQKTLLITVDWLNYFPESKLIVDLQDNISTIVRKKRMK